MESIGIDEAMRNRHSVRKYQDKPLEEHAVRELQKVIDTCNAEGHLKFQMVTGSRGGLRRASRQKLRRGLQLRCPG